MNGVTEYLLEKARELRDLILTAPEIADELRRMALELEAKAAELARDESC